VRPLEPVRATILFNHGNGGNLTTVRALAERFSARGFEVILWDYRGYGRTGGRVAGDEATFLGDAERMFTWARTPGRPLVVWGQSLGTTASADLCARLECAALVMESGLASTYEYGRTQVPWLLAWLHVFTKFEFDSAAKLARVTCPVLVAHGTADRTIHYRHGERLHGSIAHDRREWITLRGAGHWLAAVPDYWPRVESFLRRALT